MNWPWKRTPPPAAIPRPIAGAASGRREKLTDPNPAIFGPPPYPAPRLPGLPPHEAPQGRPGWWSAALPQNRLLYPDDSLNRLLEELRRTVPILDRAVTVLVGLIGKVQFTGSARGVDELERWAQSVRVNQTSRGLQSWLEAHADAMLLYGKGVGEVVPARAGGPAGLPYDIYALTNLDPRSIVFLVTDDPLQLLPLQRQRGLAYLQPLNPELLLTSVHAAQTDSPHGHSLYRSVPFVAKAARIIENATAQAWERLGAPDFHINWEPPDGFADPGGSMADTVLSDLKSQWNQVMSGKDPSAGSVADFFTAGKIKVEIIGKEGLPLSITETHRTFMEQLVAASGLPSWMLGFHWSSTERMAQQQAEILVAQIEALRRHLQPALDTLVELRQRFAGKSARVKVVWSAISLHDLTEQARGLAWQEQARQRRIANAVTMWHLGIWSQLEAAQAIDPALTRVDRPLAVPPSLPNAGPGVVGPEEQYRG